MLLIWWTNAKDCALIGRYMMDSSPAYVYELYSARSTRSASGKLYASDERDGHRNLRITWPNTEFAEQIRKFYDGIVIDAKVYKKCTYGVFTDAHLNRISKEEIEELVKEEEQQTKQLMKPPRWIVA